RRHRDRHHRVVRARLARAQAAAARDGAPAGRRQGRRRAQPPVEVLMKRFLLAIPLLLAGCFNVDERPCTFACGPGGACPDDYTCLNDGYCHLHGQPGDCAYSDLAMPDLPAPVDQAAPDLVLLVDAGAVNGSACSSASECLSGFCVDGKCCNVACTATCNACSAALNGVADGTCLAAIDGNN